jgi:hypothetical protein
VAVASLPGVLTAVRGPSYGPGAACAGVRVAVRCPYRPGGCDAALDALLAVLRPRRHSYPARLFYGEPSDPRTQISLEDQGRGAGERWARRFAREPGPRGSPAPGQEVSTQGE